MKYKYTVQTFLSDLPQDFIFCTADESPHITHVGFTTELNPQKITRILRKFCEKQCSIKTKIFAKKFFGPGGHIPVYCLELTRKFAKFHNDLVDLLEKSDTIFNRPEILRHGFKPHITDKNLAKEALRVGSVILIDRITIKQKEFSENPDTRKIIATIKFGSQNE